MPAPEPGRSSNSSRIAFTDGLSFRQARMALLVALLLGLVVTAAQITTSYFNTRANIDSGVRAIMESNISAASHITLNIDTVLAAELARGMLKYPSISEVKLVDSFGDVIGIATENDSQLQRSEIVDWLFGHADPISIDLYNPYSEHIDVKELGQLIIQVDNTSGGTLFLQTAVITLVAVVLLTLLLATILMAMFYSQVTKPLTNIALALDKIDPEASDNVAIPTPKRHIRDEIGRLIGSYNQQLRATGEHLQKRKSAEFELKFYMGELENKVDERTTEAVEAR